MSCQIILEKRLGKYSPGECIKGKLLTEFAKPHRVRSITVRIKGRESTAWVRARAQYTNLTYEYAGTSNMRMRKLLFYSGDQVFFKETCTLAGEGFVSAGKNEYPFEFVLPNKCPGSIVTGHGKVYYYMTAVIVQHYGRNYESKVNIDVVSIIDLNTLPDVNMNPITYQVEKKKCCCCCAIGPISMELRLEKQAFVLGEAIRVHIHIQNSTEAFVKSLKVELILYIKEHAMLTMSIDRQFSSYPIAKVNESGVAAWSNRDYEVLLELPADRPLPNFISCTLFKSWYTIEAEALVTGNFSDLKIHAGVTVGHVPLVTVSGTIAKTVAGTTSGTKAHHRQSFTTSPSAASTMPSHATNPGTSQRS